MTKKELDRGGERLSFPLCYYPVATVKNGVAEPIHEGWDKVVSELVVDRRLATALDGIEQFSHVQVIFFIHSVSPEQRQRLKLHPRDRADLPLTGVFAMRTQYRPNPIGVTIARLLERRDNVLLVQGLDAIDGTPVLDIKPYVPDANPTDGVRVPEWVAKARNEG